MLMALYTGHKDTKVFNRSAGAVSLSVPRKRKFGCLNSRRDRPKY